MHIIAFVLVVYVIFAEWCSIDQKKKLQICRETVAKLENDNTLWYNGVLPKAEELCLFQEVGGEYVITKLSDKRWLKKDGTVAFEKIRRWAYISDLDNI